jgi:hypothetical protein
MPRAYWISIRIIRAGCRRPGHFGNSYEIFLKVGREALAPRSTGIIFLKSAVEDTAASLQDVRGAQWDKEKNFW